MSQFEGSSLRVRCVDCLKLSGTHCTPKNIKVSPKKRRSCEVYEFKGEFQNRSPEEVIYMPHVDKKTRKLLNRLLDMGVIPTSGGQGNFSHTKTLDMPASTATASILGSRGAEDPMSYPVKDSKTPDDFNITETLDDNRS